MKKKQTMSEVHEELHQALRVLWREMRAAGFLGCMFCVWLGALVMFIITAIT